MSDVPGSWADGSDVDAGDHDTVYVDDDWTGADPGLDEQTAEDAGPSTTELVAAGVVASGVVHVIRRAWDWLRRQPVPDSGVGTAPVTSSFGPGVDPETATDEQTLARERAILIDALVDLEHTWGDRFESLRGKVGRTLTRVGVDAVVPAAGDRFDSSQHESVGAEPTTEAARHETIASTEAAGYVDRGTVVRQPQVIVYRLDGS